MSNIYILTSYTDEGYELSFKFKANNKEEVKEFIRKKLLDSFDNYDVLDFRIYFGDDGIYTRELTLGIREKQPGWENPRSKRFYEITKEEIATHPTFLDELDIKTLEEWTNENLIEI